VAPQAVLLDIDGVLVVSWEPVPGAVDALRKVRDAELPVRFLTNTTSRSRVAIAARLRELGFAVGDAELLTAGVATAEYVASHHPGARCWSLNEGPPDDFADLTLVGPSDGPDLVLIGSAGPSFDWETVNLAARAVLDGAALVAMHGSTTWRTDQGICVDGGAYVAALERATGRTATVIGKPGAAMFEAAFDQLATAPAECVMVGDDLESDVLAAQSLGARGVLVRTGKFRADELDGSVEQTTAVIDSVVDLPGWLGIV
jgi:HAD superfamily hydrolase (TIGR01458 family)